jgi:enterochelin esterase family protein
MKATASLVLGALLLATPLAAQQAPALDLASLQSALAANPQGADAERLADQIRQAFGGRDALMAGPPPLIDETTVAWAMELPAPPTGRGGGPAVYRPVGTVSHNMVRVGSTPVYALVRTFTSGEAFAWTYNMGGNRRQGGGNLEVYDIHPDARERPGVPKGEVRQMPSWSSTIFPNTTRDWWVYVPAQYNPAEPAAVMIFQDGAGARQYVVPVLDNLIAKGDIPVMVGIFLEPGGTTAPRNNRSFEYDRLSDQYARFLLEEILPEVQKTVNLRQDAAGRGIAGQSSGAIAAFTAAWERPDEFSKVLSGIGSYVNLQGGESGIGGGHNYQVMVRQNPPKPIRVFLQDGENDQDAVWGNWFLANTALAQSLGWAGYDYTFAQGKGYHSNGHMRAILPDAMRWLWR